MGHKQNNHIQSILNALYSAKKSVIPTLYTTDTVNLETWFIHSTKTTEPDVEKLLRQFRLDLLLFTSVLTREQAIIPPDQNKEQEEQKGQIQNQTGEEESDRGESGRSGDIKPPDTTTWTNKALDVLFLAFAGAGAAAISFVTVKAILMLVYKLISGFVSTFGPLVTTSILPYLAIDVAISCLDYGFKDAEELLRRKTLPSVDEIKTKIEEQAKEFDRTFLSSRDDVIKSAVKLLEKTTETKTRTAFTEQFIATIGLSYDYLLNQLLVSDTVSSIKFESFADYLADLSEPVVSIVFALLMAPRTIEHATWVLKRTSRHENVPMATIVLILLLLWIVVLGYALTKLYTQYIMTLPMPLQIAIGALVATFVTPAITRILALMYKSANIIRKHIRHVHPDEFVIVSYAIQIAIKKHVFRVLNEYKQAIVNALKGK